MTRIEDKEQKIMWAILWKWNFSLTVMGHWRFWSRNQICISSLQKLPKTFPRRLRPRNICFTEPSPPISSTFSLRIFSPIKQFIDILIDNSSQRLLYPMATAVWFPRLEAHPPALMSFSFSFSLCLFVRTKSDFRPGFNSPVQLSAQIPFVTDFLPSFHKQALSWFLVILSSIGDPT